MAQKTFPGPDPRQSFSYQDLPIGCTMVGIAPEVTKTGSWRFYRPVFVWGTAPCQEACPAGVDVRGFISHCRRKEFEQAWLWYIKENPFPAICGRLCPHPCESACNRKDLDFPVSIRALERFLSDFKRPFFPVSDPERRKRQIGIVGGGPAGLSCAFFLTRLGYQPTLIERENRIGGNLRQIPEYRLPKELIEQETGAIIEQGVEVEQREWRWEDQDRFEAVFLATGLRDATSLPPVPSLVTVENGRILVDAGCPTNRKGLFAGGEVARGRQSVAEAIGDGKRGAMAIDSYLQGKNLLQDLEGFSIGGGGSLSFEFFGSGAKQEKKVRRVVHYTDLNPALFSKRARVEVPTRSVEIEEGKSEEIEFGVSKEGAIEEASRCLQCGACNRCGRCLFDCPEGAISHGARSPRGMEIDYDFCKGCGICRNECPRGMFIFEKEETDWE